jgi:hypothetical protein
VTLQLDTVEIRCAWCGEAGETTVDPSGGDRQRYVEDCWVCCRPNVIEVQIDRDDLGELSVSVDVSPE